jgi:hypothetical protein
MAFLSVDNNSFRERAAYYGFIFYLLAMGAGPTYTGAQLGFAVAVIGRGPARRIRRQQ